MISSIYYSKFQSLLRYGTIFGEADNETHITATEEGYSDNVWCC
jgi:hypothetical protein